MKALLSNGEWNEVLISNEKMTAIYALDEAKIDETLISGNSITAKNSARNN